MKATLLLDAGIAAAAVLGGAGTAVVVRRSGVASLDPLVWQRREFAVALGALLLLSFVAGLVRPRFGWMVGASAAFAFFVTDIGVTWLADACALLVVAYGVVPCVAAAETGALVRAHRDVTGSPFPAERRFAFVVLWTSALVMLIVGVACGFGPWAALVGGLAGVVLGPLVGALLARFVVVRWINARRPVPSP